MSDNSNIQGNLRISTGINSSDTGAGSLLTDTIQEATTNSGVSLKNDVKIPNTGNIGAKLTFLNNLGEQATLQLNSSTNAAGAGVSTFNLTSNTVSLRNNSSKGLTIQPTTGDIVIDSTTDSIDINTGSVILNGGLLVKKSMNVRDEIHGLNGIHEFINTTFSENVVDVQNTNVGGLSSVNFKDNSGSIKLRVGYGNATVSSPLNSTAFIQSSAGSALFLRANDTDTIKLNTDATIDVYNTTASTSPSTGSIRMYGGLGIINTTDAVSSSSGGSLTVGGGVAIAKKLFVGGTFNINDITAPPSPGSGTKTFYIDTTDALFKSKNSAGVITTYQPTTTKGDISVHNGTTQVRLPVGTNGFVLQADSTTISGLKWAVSSSSGSSGGSSSKYNINSVNIATTIIEESTGCYLSMVYPLVLSGASCNFFHAKSFANLGGVTVRLNSNPSLVNSGVLSGVWNTYRSAQISKNYAEGVGDYIANTNLQYASSVITLSGTTYLNLSVGTTGAYCISVYSKVPGGPSATFIFTKSVASLLTGNITRIISSPGSTAGVLEIRWQANSDAQIRKTQNADTGDYVFVNNFQGSDLTTTLTLTGTAQSSLTRDVFNYYQNKSFAVKVVGPSADAPSAVFFISKNLFSSGGNVTSTRSPGLTSLELLTLSWNANSLPSISKSGNNFDGVYTLTFTKF